MDTKKLNRLFIITFTPNNRKDFNTKRKSFSIGAGKLVDYLGEEGAQKVINLADNSLEHKPRKYIALKGFVTLYNR